MFHTGQEYNCKRKFWKYYLGLHKFQKYYLGLHKDTNILQIRDTEPAAFTSLLEYIYLPQVWAVYLIG